MIGNGLHGAADWLSTESASSSVRKYHYLDSWCCSCLSLCILSRLHLVLDWPRLGIDASAWPLLRLSDQYSV